MYTNWTGKVLRLYLSSSQKHLSIIYTDLKTNFLATHERSKHIRYQSSIQPTSSIGPICLLIWSLDLRWIILLLLVIIWRKILGTGAPPTLPNAGESLWMGYSSLERGTSWKTGLRWWQMIKFLLVLQAESIIFLITTCPFFSWTQWHSGTVSRYRCWSRSIILPETCKNNRKYYCLGRNFSLA